MSQDVNQSRRRFLTASTAVVGGAGVAAAAVPFVASLAPSARAQAAGAPVQAEIGSIEPGRLVTYKWRGKPVWVVSRTAEMLEGITSLNDQVADPTSEQPKQPGYAQNEYRSIKPEILVMVGLCTHLGCSPLFRPEVEAAWKGGFFCPCHGSKFDLAGRVYSGMPAPLNMEIPPYRYVNDTTIIIGEDSEAA